MENESENACKSPPFVLLHQPPEGAIAKIHTMEGHAIRGLKGYLAILMLPSQKKRGEVENDTKIRKEATPVHCCCRLCCYQGIFKNNKRFPFSRLVMQKIG